MTSIGEQQVELRVSDADRNGTLRRLHNAVALGLIDIDEFEDRSIAGIACPHARRAGRPRRRPAGSRRDRHVRGRPGRIAGLAGLAEAARPVDRADAAGAGAAGRLGGARPHQRALRRARRRDRARHDPRVAGAATAGRGQRVDRRRDGLRRQCPRSAQERACRGHAPRGAHRPDGDGFGEDPRAATAEAAEVPYSADRRVLPRLVWHDRSFCAALRCAFADPRSAAIDPTARVRRQADRGRG